MATTNGTRMAQLLATPIDYPDPGDVGGKLRVFNEEVLLASQPIADIIRVGKLPKGARFIEGSLISTVSLGTATLKIGSTTSDAKYRAAAVHTTVDQPVLFGATAAVGVELAAEETVIATIGTAALPASGTLRCILKYTID